MGLPSLYSNQIKDRNQGDERATFYDKQTVSNILKTGGTPVIPKNTNANIYAKGSAEETAQSKALGGGNSKSSSTKKVSTKSSFDIKKEADKLKKSAQEQKEKQEKAARERIGKAFDPIQEELDRQLSNLPGRKAEYEQEIGRLSEGQRTAAEEARVKSKATLDSSRAAVGTQAETSLRDLEGDIRDQLKAKVNMLGSASQSSAANEVSEAVTREGLKGRAKILSTRDTAYADLNQKAVDIDNLATEQLGKIEEWKSSTLFQIGQDFSSQIDALNKEKATASQQEAFAIDERITGLEQDFVGRLRQLDDAVLNYKSSIATWQMQREAELEDYGKKLAMSSSYSKLEDDSKAYAAANNVFNQSLSEGLNPQEARARAMNQTGVDPLKGLEMTPELLKQIKTASANANLFITQDAIGNPVYIDKSNPSSGYNAIPALGQSSTPGAAEGEGGFFNSILKMLSGN